MVIQQSRNLRRKSYTVLYWVKDLMTEVQTGKPLAVKKETGFEASQHSLSTLRRETLRRWESCNPAIGDHVRSQVVGGGDSFPQLCSRASHEWIQSFLCVLSWVPTGMWTVNLSSYPSLTHKQLLFLPSAVQPPAFQSVFIWIAFSILLPSFLSVFSEFISSLS